MPAPANDDFANAVTLGPLPQTFGPIDLLSATTEPGEPEIIGPGFGPVNTVWFKYTPAVTVDLTIDPSASSTDDDLALGVWTGGSLATLTIVSLTYGGTAILTGTRLNAGTTYYIQIGIGGLAAPTIATLRVAFSEFVVVAPANDDFADAQLLSGSSGVSAPVSADYATVQPGEQPSASNFDDPHQTVWYRWTSPYSATATFDLAGSGTEFTPGDPVFSDYVLAVWQGSELGSLTEVASVATASDPSSSVSFSAHASEVYWIQVGWQYHDPDHTIFVVNWSVVQTPVIRLEGPPIWRLLVTDLTGETLTILDKRSTERAFLFQLDGPATHTGLVPSDDPEINIPSPSADSPAFVSHNTRLVYGLRRERRAGTSSDPWVCRFGGILMTPEDVAADAPTTRYTAYDPWQYLMARPARNPDGTLPGADGVRYRNARASAIAVELLANTVAADGDVFIDASDAGLVEATDVISGVTQFAQGLSVGEAWQQLCDTGTIDIVLRPIYDPHGRPGKLCELVISKRAGAIRYSSVFGWDRAGRNLTELSRLVDGTRLANKLQLLTGTGIPVPIQTDAGSVTAYGEYWAQPLTFGKQGQGPLALLLALAQLLIRRNGDRTITFTPAPERADIALIDYGLGDYVPLWASRALREPLGIDYPSFDVDAPGGCGYQRIFAIPIDLDDNGVERVNTVLTSAESASG